MGSRWTMAGMEVPIIGSDSVRWIELSLPSSSSASSRDTDTDIDTDAATATCSPLIHDFASCSAIGDPPNYLIWRIHKSQPNALELLELSASREFPRTGLRITFSDALSPFAFLCKNEVDMNSRNHPYLLYALTESGVAYLLRIRNISSYSSSSVFPTDDLLIAFDMRAYGPITSAAVTASGCFVVGRNDGSVGCFQLGTLDPTAPAFAHELRDDSGIGRLWGFMSRGRMVGAVQDMVISEIQGKRLLFVLHSDGILRVWDLSCYSKVFSHTMNVPTVAGGALVRLSVGAARDLSIIPLAVLCRHTLEISSETIYLCSLQYSMRDRISLLLDPCIQSIPLGEVGCIDVKLTSDKIWILKDNGLVLQALYSTEVNMEDVCYYALQEEFVADQLFQGPENSSDELLSIAHSIFSSAKDHIVPVVSSIFLRRLLQPGVHHSIALRSTFLDYNRHWTDSDFQTLTSDGLKKEILSLIEHEGVAENLMSIHSSWKNFCTRYFDHWCKCNAPCGLLVESADGAVGLIRKNSFSLFRSLVDIERFIYGSSEGLGEPISLGLDLFDDLEHEVLVDLLRCVTSISQYLGKTASSIFYESLVSTPVISFEEVVPCILKFLETGYSSSVATLKLSELGTHVAWEKKLMDHKNLRKFSVDMLLSLHALCRKAVTWSKVLSVIEGYLKFLVPQKIVQNLDAEPLLDISASILVQATAQVAKMMFESALDILLFLSYLVNNSGQINLSPDDICKIQLELVPMIQEIISEWLIVHFFATTPSESAVIEDFSSQLSLLQIDSSSGKQSWNEKLGKCDFPLAFVLLLNIRVLPGDQNQPYSRCLPYLHDIISSMRTFASWIVWGKSGESSTFLSHSTELALILLRHGQYDAVEHLLRMVEAHSQKEKTSESIQDTDGGWCILHHLLGCCLLAQAQRGLHGMLKERKVCEAVRCFFRASSVKDASQALQSLPHEAGLPLLDFSSVSGAAWKLHYYQWVMQIFEQYDISEGACMFALAALEQVEEALSTKDENPGRDPFNESATTIKGRLWANVFKFALDLRHFHDAYCAIISNPDEESKYICLRRFIIVLYECGAMKILCSGQLPFIGLIDKVEQELVWKAERSDILMKPNLYKLLYAFEMHRHNWRRAASYIYQYCDRLRTEAAVRDYQHSSLDLQERLNGLSAAINALHLVHPAYAWIDPLLERHSVQDEHCPLKRARRSVEEESSGNDFQPQKLHSYIDIEQIENEFVLTSAEYLLSLAHVKWRFTGIHKAPSDLVDLLIQTDLYDMAFTVLLKFFKGSDLKRELERVFSAMSLKCCPNKVDSSRAGDDRRNHGFLLTSSKDEVAVHSSPDMGPTSQQSKGISRWGTLELYLEKYRAFHARLPLIVAETLLRTDPQIELPLWLVNMFKDGQRKRIWGMTGQESNPALLFRIYVDYGRYTEATNLLIEYIDSYASMRPADLINRKKPFAIWFPYTAIQRLWCQLEELIRLGRMEDQCDKLKGLLRGALLKHLKLLKVDSEDAISAAG